jgi:endonuclease-3 related protein
MRKKILSVNGIGPETADSILLYALGKKAFVVDAYTKRVFYRHGLIGREDDYHAVQKIFLQHFDRDIQSWNEYHALIVRLAKEYCRTKPLCEQCPMNDLNYSLQHKCRECHLFLSKAGHCPECHNN